MGKKVVKITIGLPPKPRGKNRLTASQHFREGRKLHTLADRTKNVRSRRRLAREAIDHYYHCYSLNKSQVGAILNWAMLLNSLGSTDKAIELLQFLVQAVPGYGVAHHHLALYYKQTHDYEKHFKHLVFALDSNPPCRRAHLDLGIYYSHRYLFTQAFKHFRACLRMQDEPKWFANATREQIQATNYAMQKKRERKKKQPLKYIDEPYFSVPEQ